MSNPEVPEVVSHPCVFCGNATVAEKELVEGDISPWPYPVCYLCLSRLFGAVDNMLIAAGDIAVVWRSFFKIPSDVKMQQTANMVLGILNITRNAHERAVEMGDMRYMIEEIEPLPEIGKYGMLGGEIGIGGPEILVDDDDK